METTTLETPQVNDTENQSAQPETSQITQTDKPDYSAALAAIEDQKNGKPYVPPVAAVKEEAPAPEQPKVEAANSDANAPAIPAEYFKSKSEGYIESDEDFTRLVQEHRTFIENPVLALPEADQQILQAIKQFENPAEYFAFQSKDFKAMEPEAILKEQFLKDNADLPAELVEAAFQRELGNKYPHLDSGDETSNDYKLDKIRMEKDANKHRTELLQKQEEGRIKPAAPAEKPDQELLQKQLNEYHEQVKTKLSALNEIKVKVGSEGSEITVGIEGKENLEKALANPIAYLDSHLTKDGKWDIDKLITLANFLENGDKVNATIYANGKEAGTKELVEAELKNPKQLAPTVQPETSNWKDAALNAIGQHNQKSNQNF